MREFTYYCVVLLLTLFVCGQCAPSYDESSQEEESKCTEEFEPLARHKGWLSQLPSSWIMPAMPDLSGLSSSWVGSSVVRQDNQLVFIIEGYQPDEVTVTVDDKTIKLVGKHEEKSEINSSKSYISRQFTKMATLPYGATQNDVVTEWLAGDKLKITVTSPTTVKTTPPPVVPQTEITVNSV